MITETDLQHWTRQIVSEFQPERIILFGSYATGHPASESDVDLLVVMPFEGHPVRMATKIRKSLGKWLHALQHLDIRVSTPNEIDYRLGYGNKVFSSPLNQGRVLYEQRPASTTTEGSLPDDEALCPLLPSL